jgi:diguanylate cyclase (GGDEF)-like protein
MRILVADANPLIARLLRVKLESWGHTVDVEHTGDRAWILAQERPYRMAIMDWGLEGIETARLCKQIRDLNSNRYCFIMFFSEQSDHENLMAAFEAGADDYLLKPLNPQLLKLRIKTGKRMLNLEEELRLLSSYDQLTGLISYRTFVSFFRTFLAVAVRNDLPGSVIFLEVENYRQILEQNGHLAATKIMVELSRALPVVMRASDLVAKVDDNSFCVLLPQTPEENLGVLVANIERAIGGISVNAAGQEVRPSVAISVVNYPVEQQSAEEILLESNRRSLVQSSPAAE